NPLLPAIAGPPAPFGVRGRVAHVIHRAHAARRRRTRPRPAPQSSFLCAEIVVSRSRTSRSAAFRELFRNLLVGDHHSPAGPPRRSPAGGGFRRPLSREVSRRLPRMSRSRARVAGDPLHRRAVSPGEAAAPRAVSPLYGENARTI